MAADLQSALVAAGEPLNKLVEPRGVEPRSQDFQSCAYTKSAKVPCLVAPDGFEPPPPDPESDVLTITPWSNYCDEGGTRTHDRLLRRQLLGSN